MLHAQRLDLGADVVVIPSRDLVVIHPDLDYAEALGAVMGTLPHLHPDAAVALVDQVTPRPTSETRRAGTLVASVGVAVAGLVLAGATATAQAEVPDFGPRWAQQMNRLGLDCEDRLREGVAWTCTDAQRRVYKVEGFSRRDSDLYVVDGKGYRASVLVFETDRAAEQYAERHPAVEIAGRVAMWVHHGATPSPT